jgi:glutathione synthase/RimK-type ligase-like ATP-grasp enzyme
MDIVFATCHTQPDLTPPDALLRAELLRRGATVTVAPWDTITSTTDSSSVVCLRSTWDYHRRWPEFQRWIGSFARRPGALWNPPETVLWNADKLYLRELATAGVPIPLTRWLEPGERLDYGAILREWGLPRGVLKPRISATAYGTHLVSPDRHLSDSDWRHLDAVGGLLQAFVPEVETEGEASLVFIDGSFSHAVRKRPTRGDFRVQSDFGGSMEPMSAEASLREFGVAVLARVSRPWLYARVDVVETRQGPVLMELELIEPQLFLTAAAAVRLAEALESRGDPGRASAPRWARS